LYLFNKPQKYYGGKDISDKGNNKTVQISNSFVVMCNKVIWVKN